MYGYTNRSRISKQPSFYPPLAFHILRLGQLLSSLIVTIVLSFFVHHLKVERYSIPWTFLLVRNLPRPYHLSHHVNIPQLLTVSILTLIALVSTSILYHFRTLSPKLNLYSNTFLSVLWVLGLSFLTWNLSYTLGHHCSRETWKNTAGIMVCRLYKALTAFTVTGLYVFLQKSQINATNKRHHPSY